MAVINVYKPLGWTPLQAMEKLRTQDARMAQSVMTYAGRLDPMAEGVLLVLTDEDRLRREEFMGRDKVYRATFLFGYSSDSYDALGFVQKGGDVPVDRLVDVLRALGGVHELPFPPYSAYKVQGKPLHWWAQQGRLGEIDIATKAMTVQEVCDVKIATMSSEDVAKEVVRRIGLVRGEFRQKESVDRWHDVLQSGHVTTATLTLTVASGTYIRALAQTVGAQLGCGALLLELQRTSVGEYRAEDALRLT